MLLTHVLRHRAWYNKKRRVNKKPEKMNEWMDGCLTNPLHLTVIACSTAVLGFAINPWFWVLMVIFLVMWVMGFVRWVLG